MAEANIQLVIREELDDHLKILGERLYRIEAALMTLVERLLSPRHYEAHLLPQQAIDPETKKLVDIDLTSIVNQAREQGWELDSHCIVGIMVDMPGGGLVVPGQPQPQRQQKRVVPHWSLIFSRAVPMPEEQPKEETNVETRGP